MKLTDFRHRFPEYDDMPDADVAIVLSELFPASEKDFRLEEAMEVLAESFKGLEKALVRQPKEKEEKKTDYSPLLLALGQQMAKIETAILNYEPPVINFPEMPTHTPVIAKSLKVKRNELGYITEIIPTY